MQYGLLGRHLGHSYSPQIHNQLGSWPYSLFEQEPQNIEDFLKNVDFTGINVTIPYKKDVIPYCAELSEIALKLGAVNTIVRRRDGSLVGHNTDYFGFSEMLNRSGLNILGKKVLILGSGGASVTALAVLEEAGADVVVISRSGRNNYGNLHLHYDASVIVNATPVGMYPNVNDTPINIEPFYQLEGVLDLIYNPARTMLIRAAEARGVVTGNGLWMLVAQAKESAEWFQDRRISDDMIHQIHSNLRLQMENIVLIGMPGCGKSTIGHLLAKKLHKEFIDADAQIQDHTGKTIPEIFNELGEDGFRKIETQVIEELGKRSGLVIATGGGCITRQENYGHLHQNGTIIWLQRDIDKLPTDGRPLSQACQLTQMYAARKPLYEQFSDLSVENADTPERTAETIVKTLNKEYNK